METRISICCKCGEADYRDSMCFVDGDCYCHLCADMLENNNINQLIKEYHEAKNV